MPGAIYGLIDSDTLELRYIGQTIKSLNVRLCKHKASNNGSHLSRWLAKANVTIIMLEHNPVDLNEAERCWIADMRVQGARLLNITDGGKGGSFTGRRHTPESIAKMRTSHMGQKSWNKGKTASIQARIRMSAAQLGKIFTPEHRAKIGAAVRHAYARRAVTENSTNA